MTTQLALGEAPPPVDPKTLPLAQRRPRDFDMGWMEWFARRESDIGLDESLSCYALETLMDGAKPSDVVKVSFAGVRPPISRGPNKGRRRWDMSRRREVYISRKAFRAAEVAWEVETGLCADCDDGQEVWSVGVDGRKLRPCRKCNGTGRAPSPQGGTP